MGLLDKWLKITTPLKCGDVSTESIIKEQTKIRARIEDVRATLNGEDDWFLVLNKGDSNLHGRQA